MIDLICPNCGADEPSDFVGIEVQGVYDGILVWECLRCRERWPRFTEGVLYRKAAEFLLEEKSG